MNALLPRLSSACVKTTCMTRCSIGVECIKTLEAHLTTSAPVRSLHAIEQTIQLFYQISSLRPTLVRFLGYIDFSALIAL